MKKSFIIIGSVINALAIAVFVFVGCDLKAPHRLEDGVTLVTLTALTIVLGWLITLVLGRKLPDRIPDALACSYVAAAMVFTVTTGVVIGNWALTVVAIMAALGVLGIACVLVCFTLFFTNRF